MDRATPPTNRIWPRLRLALAGTDGPGRRAIPAGELLHPAVLAAVALLVVNDWLLKGAGGVPSLVTGKLSDLCGLFAAPLAATAALDCALWLVARTGRQIDFSLGRGRLYGASCAVAVAFAACKLSPDVARWLEDAAAVFGLHWRITPDPTDLVALPMIAAALWLGHRHIARVPLGRLEVLERAWRTDRRDPAPGLSDVARLGGDPDSVRQLASSLAEFFAGGPAEPVWVHLGNLRGVPHPHR